MRDASATAQAAAQGAADEEAPLLPAACAAPETAEAGQRAGAAAAGTRRRAAAALLGITAAAALWSRSAFPGMSRPEEEAAVPLIDVGAPSDPVVFCLIALCTIYAALFAWLWLRHTERRAYPIYCYLRDFCWALWYHSWNCRALLNHKTTNYRYEAPWLPCNLQWFNEMAVKEEPYPDPVWQPPGPAGLRVRVESHKEQKGFPRDGTVVGISNPSAECPQPRLKVCLDFAAERNGALLEQSACGSPRHPDQDSVGGSVLRIPMQPGSPPKNVKSLGVKHAAAEGWALRYSAAGAAGQTRPGAVLRHDTAADADAREDRAPGGAWHQRRFYLTHTHLEEGGLQHEVVRELGPGGRAGLIAFACLSIAMAYFSVCLCLACLLCADRGPHLPVWVTRNHHTYRYWYTDYSNLTIAESLPNAAVMCARFGLVSTPLVLSSLQVVVTNYFVSLAFGLPLKGIEEEDWWPGLRRRLYSCCGWSEPGGGAPPGKGERCCNASVVGICYVAYNLLMFLWQYYEAFQAYQSHSLAHGWWDAYQTALVVIFLSPSALALSQVLIRLGMGQVQRTALQWRCFQVGLGIMAIAGLPALVTHVLPAAGMVLLSLVCLPVAGPVLALLEQYGLCPEALLWWPLALSVRAHLATIGSNIVAVGLAVAAYALLQYPVACVLWLCGSVLCCRQCAQSRYLELCQRAQSGDRSITPEQIADIPEGTVVRIPAEDSTSLIWYKKNNLLGHYCVYLGKRVDGRPLWRFDTGRDVSLPHALGRGPAFLGVPAAQCNKLRCGWMWHVWQKHWPHAVKAAVLAIIASFLLQSLIVYQVLVYGGRIPYNEIPVIEFDARSAPRWLLCTCEHALKVLPQWL